jgi:hypothetical protein
MLKVTVDSYERAKDCRFERPRQDWRQVELSRTAVLEDGQALQRNQAAHQGYLATCAHQKTARLGAMDTCAGSSISPPKSCTNAAIGRSVLVPVKTFLAWALETYPEIQRAQAQFDGRPTTDDSPQARGEAAVRR